MDGSGGGKMGYGDHHHHETAKLLKAVSRNFGIGLVTGFLLGSDLGEPDLEDCPSWGARQRCWTKTAAAARLSPLRRQYDECIKDCDVAVERGRELRVDFKMISRALTRKGTALAKLAKSSKDYELF